MRFEGITMDGRGYEELAAQIQSGKGVEVKGRSAATIAELDWIFDNVAPDGSPPEEAGSTAEDAMELAELSLRLDQLQNMTVRQLTELAKELGVDPLPARKGELVEAIAAKEQGALA